MSKTMSIIIHADAMTSDEKHLEMIRQIEKKMNTGPIIGESREVIIELSRNIMVRDYLLESMGVDVKTREKLFFEVGRMIEENDKRVIQKRSQK